MHNLCSLPRVVDTMRMFPRGYGAPTSTWVSFDVSEKPPHSHATDAEENRDTALYICICICMRTPATVRSRSTHEYDRLSTYMSRMSYRRGKPVISSIFHTSTRSALYHAVCRFTPWCPPVYFHSCPSIFILQWSFNNSNFDPSVRDVIAQRNRNTCPANVTQWEIKTDNPVYAIHTKPVTTKPTSVDVHSPFPGSAIFVIIMLAEVDLYHNPSPHTPSVVHPDGETVCPRVRVSVISRTCGQRSRQISLSPDSIEVCPRMSPLPGWTLTLIIASTALWKYTKERDEDFRASCLLVYIEGRVARLRHNQPLDNFDRLRQVTTKFRQEPVCLCQSNKSTRHRHTRTTVNTTWTPAW